MKYDEERDEYTCHNNKKLNTSIQRIGEVLQDMLLMSVYMDVKIVVLVHTSQSVQEVKEIAICRCQRNS